MPIIALERLPVPSMRTLRLYACCSVAALSVCLYVATQHVVGGGKTPPPTAATATNTMWMVSNWYGGGKDPGGGGSSSSSDETSTTTNIFNFDSGQNNVSGVADGGGDNLTADAATSTFHYYEQFDAASITQFVVDVFKTMMREPICMWTLINMAFCSLILIGTSVQQLVFGELRVSEQQHLKDKFWNFVFYKFIFVFGIINVQYIDEVLLWCFWFSFLGFLHLLCQLTKDRFEYLSFSATTPIWNHIKLLVLLVVIFALSGFMLLVSVFVGFFGGFNTFAFMSAEVILLSIRTLYIIIRYMIHLYDVRHETIVPSTSPTAPTTPAGSTPPPGTPPMGGVNINEQSRPWEKRGPVSYYVELCFEMCTLIIDFVHHMHMLIWSNIFLSMASLVICMQLRYLFHEIQRRYKKHRNYLWVRQHLEQNYPMATIAELAANSDNCAICWEKMEAARRLPCTHLFHNTCLLSWLEQDTSCPTCRLSLSIHGGGGGPGEGATVSSTSPPPTTPPTRRQFNHFFHFDGSRYVSWLPSFSVEVSHAQLPPPHHHHHHHRHLHHLHRHLHQALRMRGNSQLDTMARQVQTLFPTMPMATILNDLSSTHSLETTIDNILDGRLVALPTSNEGAEPIDVIDDDEGDDVGGDTVNTTPPTPTTTPSRGEELGEGNNTNFKSIQSWTSWFRKNTNDTTAMEEEVTGSNLFLGGGRFSKSPTEREKILSKRKKSLLQSARKRYIEKQKSTGTVPPPSGDGQPITTTR